ncbi:uncharacterized protein GGS22DRAFT_104255 [Annulohypoxylon maeteangense]|uniref:uncharacterized protein n=1 Tax=Annulohypoxylon maeteangense TaxID=1927788 RepID=UPI0020087C2E|nr:uncharacterized protein GGS22DRAFT_104255 [Annulohypoxylon maeteangense]KAI0887095.1 hypothetical protein GGS22DRAFT_104255 [Annulohypoxylon maeteangense]
MSSGRALRGSCHCGRNQYIITIPTDTSDVAQMVFDSAESQRMSSATFLSEFLRVPIHWYHSQIFPFFPDESRATIRRAYSHPDEQSVIRQFCGFCGTTLTYWTEDPVTEAGYIQITLGSLLTEDLYDLGDMGLVPDDPEQESEQDRMEIESASETGHATQSSGHDVTGIPWFESLTFGSRLGSIYAARRVEESRDGRVRVEYEITEWAEGDDAAIITGLVMEEEEEETTEVGDGKYGEEAMAKPEPESPATGKRKRGESEDGDENVGNAAQSDV